MNNNDSIYSDVLIGMMNEINTVQQSGSLVGTMTLIYVCIDAMSYLNTALGKNKQDRDDFVKWVNNYLKCPSETEYQYAGADVYAARCGQLHTYSATSDFSRTQKTKIYGYHNGPHHRYNHSENPDLVIISVPKFKNDFFKAILAFLQSAKNDPDTKLRIDARIRNLYQQFHLEDSRK